ncbi:MAG: GIY-YIG nuclease family protein [Gammaproteobacteria bacterium]|nr:GIY-YIG nuclease family protein [Gammaproteobacteria bacterium]
MRARKQLFRPSPAAPRESRSCEFPGCESEALTFSIYCESHYDDLAKRALTPDQQKCWEGLNVTPTHVYFVEAGGFIKIGQTRRGIKQRIADARTFCPLPIVVLACVETEHWVERALHAALAEHRERGEWFRPAPAVQEAADLAAQSRTALEAFARPHAKVKGGKSKYSALKRAR